MIGRILLRAALGLLVVIVLLIGLPFILPRGLRRRWTGLFYQGGRPTTLGRRGNRAIAWVAAHGLTPETWPVETRGGTISLEVRGRRSGQPHQNVVTWVEHEGEQYLVSMLGEDADWVRNVRAAGGAAAVLHGGRREVRLVEVPVELRAPVLRKYVKLTATSTSDHLGVEPDDPIEAFERIAPTHPVFRMVDAEAASGPTSAAL